MSRIAASRLSRTTGTPAEEVAGEGHRGDPQRGADGRPDEEVAAVHPADPGDERDVGAHDRHEAADDQGLGAVLLEEVVGLVEVLLADDPAVVVAQRRARSRDRSRSRRRCRRRPRRRARGSRPRGGCRASPPAMKMPIANSRESPGRTGRTGRTRRTRSPARSRRRRCRRWSRRYWGSSQSGRVRASRAQGYGAAAGSRPNRAPRVPCGLTPYPRARATSSRRSGSGPGPARGRRASHGTPSCCATATGATSSTATATGGMDADRRRPRHPSPPVPRRRRELGARLQHRLRGPHRERVQRRRVPRRRKAAVEPPRRDGHRPLPARAPPPDASTTSSRGRHGRTALPLLGIDNLPGSVPLETYDLPARVRAACFGQEGPGLSAPRCARPATSCCTSRSSAPPGPSTRAPPRHRDARLGAPARLRPAPRLRTSRIR